MVLLIPEMTKRGHTRVWLTLHFPLKTLSRSKKPNQTFSSQQVDLNGSDEEKKSQKATGVAITDVIAVSEEVIQLPLNATICFLFLQDLHVMHWTRTIFKKRRSER
jgi:hypothetical protein